MINTVIQDNITALNGYNTPTVRYGYGPRDFANNHDFDNWPQSWLYPFRALDEFTPARTFAPKRFEVLMDFLNLHPMDANEDTITATQATMFAVSEQFLVQLAADPRVQGLSGIVREPLWFYFDANTAGYGLKLIVTLKPGVVNYCVPAIPVIVTPPTPSH